MKHSVKKPLSGYSLLLGLSQNILTDIAFALGLITLLLIGRNLFEILFTEWWFVTNSLSNWHYIVLFLGLIGGSFIVLQSTTRLIRKNLNFMLLGTSIFFVVTLLGNHLFKNHIVTLQQIPKIQSISQEWSIQGDVIRITGKNFGHPWQPGFVSVGNLNFRIISWDDNTIVAEQPFSDSYFSAPLVLVNYRGKADTLSTFTIRNPDEVL